MARADSVIRVSIIGDAKKLVGALGQADKATGGLLGSTTRTLGTTLLALGAVREGFAFLQTSTQEADRLGDAIQRLDIQLGTELTNSLEATASGFRDIGASSQDILELEANFADLATTLGISDDLIAANADEVAAIATAVSLLEDIDPAAVVEQIGRAAGGSAKALLALGVNLTDAEVAARAMKDTGKANADALTDQELAAARLALIIEQLTPKLSAATDGTADLELQQRRLDAAAEELQAKLGGPLSDALATVLGFINDEIDAIPHAVSGFEQLGQAGVDFARFVLGPLGNVRDVLDAINRALNATPQRKAPAGFDAGGFDEQDVFNATINHNERNGITRATGPQIRR
jgi:hypothetical protein